MWCFDNSLIISTYVGTLYNLFNGKSHIRTVRRVDIRTANMTFLSLNKALLIVLCVVFIKIVLKQYYCFVKWKWLSLQNSCIIS